MSDRPASEASLELPQVLLPVPSPNCTIHGQLSSTKNSPWGLRGWGPLPYSLEMRLGDKTSFSLDRHIISKYRQSLQKECIITSLSSQLLIRFTPGNLKAGSEKDCLLLPFATPPPSALPAPEESRAGLPPCLVSLPPTSHWS